MSVTGGKSETCTRGEQEGALIDGLALEKEKEGKALGFSRQGYTYMGRLPENSKLL